MGAKDRGGGKTAKKTAAATLKQKRQAKKTKRAAVSKSASMSE